MSIHTEYEYKSCSDRFERFFSMTLLRDIPRRGGAGAIRLGCLAPGTWGMGG